MKRVKFTPDLMEQINITPMMDTAMTLLLIFVIISPIIGRGIEVKLPAAEAEKLPVTATVLLTVDRQGTIYLAGRVVAKRHLAGDLAVLREANPEVRVVVQADRDIRYERVINLLDAVRRSGIRDVGLATRFPEPESPGR